MTPERKQELMEQAAVMIAAAEGKEIEYKCRGCSDDDYERLIIIEVCHFDWHDYEYRIKKVSTIKYIPFTAETFKEHRDRWIIGNVTGNLYKAQIITSDYVIFGEEAISFITLLENFKFENGEPCGQKVTE